MDEYHPIVIQSKHLHTHTHTLESTGLIVRESLQPDVQPCQLHAALCSSAGTRRELILREETSVESQLEEMGGMREGRRKRAGGEGLWPHRQPGHPSPLEVLLLSLS